MSDKKNEKIRAFRQRLAKHFNKPEAELEADDIADQLACQWADELENRLNAFTDTEGRITQLLADEPSLLSMIDSMLNDRIPLRVAVKRTLTSEGLDPQPGDDDYADFAQKKADADSAAKRLDDNLLQSLAILRQFAKDKQLDETAQQALVDAINSDFDNLLERRLTADMLQGYRNRLNYDADLEAARSAGELKGRNDNIEARMQADLQARLGDGLPPTDRGAYAPRMLKGKQPVIDFSKIIDNR